VNPQQLDPVAKILVRSYMSLLTENREFKERYDSPLTTMAKVHTQRTIAQCYIREDERYLLGSDYVEYGRVQLDDIAGGQTYLLRSMSASKIEGWQGSLFGTRYLKSDVVLLIYSFKSDGLELSVSSSKQQRGRTRLVATGKPHYIGLWSYITPDATPPFDQEEVDPWDELGDLDEDQEGTGE
jgi:hypothetical protein